MNIEKQKTEFINYCLYEKNLGPKTLKAYEIDIRQFIVFLNDNQYPKTIKEIDKQIIRHYLRIISSAKPKTIKRKVATLKAMFNYLEYEDKITINPFRKMRIQIKEPKILPNVMNVGEIESILKALYYLKQKIVSKSSYLYEESIRNIAVVELLFATGVRVSELSYLKAEYINLQTGTVRVKGKGNKERIIQICNEETINALIEYRNSSISTSNSTEYFFINRLGKRLSEQSIRYLIKKQAQVAGINRHITPHAFRHSFATLLLEEDVDIKYIQHILGHSSIMTTQIYTHVNAEKQKQILQKHPRKNIQLRYSLVS